VAASMARDSPSRCSTRRGQDGQDPEGLGCAAYLKRQRRRDCCSSAAVIYFGACSSSRSSNPWSARSIDVPWGQPVRRHATLREGPDRSSFWQAVGNTVSLLVMSSGDRRAGAGGGARCTAAKPEGAQRVGGYVLPAVFRLAGGGALVCSDLRSVYGCSTIFRAGAGRARHAAAQVAPELDLVRRRWRS